MSNFKNWIGNNEKDVVAVDLLNNELLFVDSVYSNVKKLEGFFLSNSKFYAISQYGLEFDTYIEELNYLRRYYSVPSYRFFAKEENMEDGLIRHLNSRHQSYINGETHITGVKIVTNDRADSFLYQMKQEDTGFTIYLPDELVNQKVQETLAEFKSNLKVNLSEEDTVQGVPLQ